MHSPSLNALMHRLVALAKSNKVTPQVRGELLALVGLLNDGLVEVHEAIDEAKNIGVRNPSFDGDMVGWLDDDFTD
ncbi:MAG: hypothetical protein HC828_21930 [Blastochloris sp.]|nr:hypothetical protein [Blastochloris sp.]